MKTEQQIRNDIKILRSRRRELNALKIVYTAHLAAAETLIVAGYATDSKEVQDKKHLAMSLKYAIKEVEITQLEIEYAERISHLDEDTKRMALLLLYQGYTYEKIANKLHWSPATVYRKMSRLAITLYESQY